MVKGYEPIEVLYRGAITVVSRSRQSATGKNVIIKQLVMAAQTPAQVARMHYEHRLLDILAQANAANCARPVEVIEQDGGVALILEDIGGSALRDEVDRGTMALVDVLQVGARIAQALEDVHACRIAHKDINPNNIIVNPKTGAVQLIDFNIASLLRREVQGDETLEAIEGTLAFASPEQTGRMNRPLDYRTDLYSLGATLYALITGKLPFDHQDSAALLHAIITEMPTPMASIVPAMPPAVEAVVARLMAKAAEERYQSATGARHDLERCLALLTTTGTAPAFPLGTADGCAELNIPATLYGRATAVAQLESAYSRASENTRQVVFVAGPSGAGKSALVGELQRLLVRQQGMVLSGKYDLLQRSIPFNGVCQALDSLVRRVLAMPEDRLVVWQRRLQGAVGGIGQSLVDMVPSFQRLLGPQKPIPSLGPQETENRVMNMLHRVVVALCAKEPLVLFLDDLQWADSGTLRLLKRLFTEAVSGSLLLVGAYRSEEVGAAHPLAPLLDLGTREAEAITIEVGPLTGDDLTRLVQDTLTCEAAQAKPLAALLFAKTGGNAFFVREFIGTLYTRDLITYDPRQHRWRWDMDAIAAAEVTGNMGDLLARRLQTLAPQARDMVSFAACMGGTFHLEELAQARGFPPAQVAALLQPALEAGFVVPSGGRYRYAAETGEDVIYQFAHDRVLQAAYELSSEADRQQYHYAIGNRLLTRMGGDAPAAAIFSVIRHVNAARALHQAAGNTRDLVLLNLRAGRAAKKAVAYGTAAEYYGLAMELLGEGGWESDYPTLRDAALELADCKALTGFPEEAERLIAAAHTRATSATGRLETVRRKAILMAASSRYEEANESLRRPFADLGLNHVSNPTPPTVAVEVARLFWTAWRKDALRSELKEATGSPLNHLVQRTMLAMAVPGAGCLSRLGCGRQSAGDAAGVRRLPRRRRWGDNDPSDDDHEPYYPHTHRNPDRAR